MKKLAGVGFGLGLVLAASQADATVTYNVATATVDPSAGYLVGTVHNNSPYVNEDAYIGRLLLTGKDSNGASFSFDSFCVDIFDNLSAPATFTVGSLSVLGLDTTQTGQLTKLLANVDGYIAAGANATDKAERSAAAQMAVWEIVNENTSTLDVNGSDRRRGTFYVSGLDDPISGKSYNDAAVLLGNVQSGGAWADSAGTQVALITANGNQTQIVYGANAARVMAVPEPATWGMMVVGFGALGASLRRKRAPAHAIG